jgi:hypothetical protein
MRFKAIDNGLVNCDVVVDWGSLSLELLDGVEAKLEVSWDSCESIGFGLGLA